MSGEQEENVLHTLEFVDEQERAHFATAQLGEQVRAFLVSPSGRYLHGRAKQQLDICKESAIECNPNSLFGRRKLKRIQHDAGIAKAFIQWCTDALQEGDMSARQLQEYR